MAATNYSATIKGGFFEANNVPTLTGSRGKSPFRRLISQLLGKNGLLAERQRIRTLNGVVAGSTATKTWGRIQDSTELGGARTIETINLVNAATVSADQTEINQDFLQQTTNSTFGASPPANLDGNPLGTR